MTEVAAPKAKKDPIVETVTMEDGRIVEFTGKRKLNKESTIGADGKIAVRLDFRNGATRTFTIPDVLMAKFAAHGAEQKLGDEIAGLKGADGGEANLDDAVLAIDNLIDRLYDGEWNTQREANGLAGTSVLLRALVEFTGKNREEIRLFLKDKTQAEKIALRNNPRIKPIVERLESEKANKAGAGIDSDALLGAL